MHSNCSPLSSALCIVMSLDEKEKVLKIFSDEAKIAKQQNLF